LIECAVKILRNVKVIVQCLGDFHCLDVPESRFLNHRNVGQFVTKCAFKTLRTVKITDPIQNNFKVSQRQTSKQKNNNFASFISLELITTH
jgi:hypothetical protein